MCPTLSNDQAVSYEAAFLDYLIVDLDFFMFYEFYVSEKIEWDRIFRGLKLVNGIYSL